MAKDREGGNKPTKKGASRLSLLLALLVIAIAGALATLIFHGADKLGRIESRNDMEGVLNALLGGLRDHESFASIIEASKELQAKIAGLGVYAADGSLLDSWGRVPPSSLSETAAAGTETEDNRGRRYIERDREGTVVLLIRTSRLWPPPPPKSARRGPEPPPDRGGFFEILKRSEFIHLELRQPDWFRGKRLRSFLFPASLAGIAALVLGIRRLIARNAEYRADLEAQRNLVVLGTAASTLAHEIKNPLLAIRLQTSLLARSFPGEKPPELDVIDAEVERLGALSRRVGDFLRDPRGRPVPLSLAEAAGETARRLLGRDPGIATKIKDQLVVVDPERLRSILENLLRNALESGGPEAEIGISLGREGDRLVLEILDRGRGLGGVEAERLFDPFYTTKSSGSGIGLAISRRFARAADGEVRLETREGGGVRSVLLLPVSSGPRRPAEEGSA
ncbi:MAG TPA: HAMP domain-containing sensor histidine kinase [Rectinemataceae bacterium]|nr:HAMP domain-containing sensor histidine kinase [Rectinemataceae bacterium]